jgi:hypothetical protein
MAIYANYISQKGTKLSQKRPDVHTRPSTVSKEITQKYKDFSDDLHPDEVTENTPLNPKGRS